MHFFAARRVALACAFVLMALGSQSRANLVVGSSFHLKVVEGVSTIFDVDSSILGTERDFTFFPTFSSQLTYAITPTAVRIYFSNSEEFPVTLNPIVATFSGLQADPGTGVSGLTVDLGGTWPATTSSTPTSITLTTDTTTLPAFAPPIGSSYTIQFQPSVNPVPEPATIGLGLLGGLLGLLTLRKQARAGR